MNNITKSNILNYLKIIQNNYNEIEQIGLFGSYAKDNSNDFSDIDVAIKLRKQFLENSDVWCYFNTLNSVKETLSSHFHKKVDVFDLDSKSDILSNIKKEIVYV
jgi:predicted nucleotidyltransferase